jgi:hypothetical protein
VIIKSLEALNIGPCFLMSLFTGELQMNRKYVINRVRNSGNTCSHEKKIDVILW